MHARPDDSFVRPLRPRRRAVLRAAGGLLALSATRLGAAPAEPLRALVIGNAAYVRGGRLANAAKDAQAVGLALEARGFQVLRSENATLAQMQQAADRFLSELKGGVGLFYYAGHGVQLGQRNYAIPVDIDAATEAELAAQSLAVDDFIGRLSGSGARLGVVVLDACRDNPFGSRKDFAGLAPKDAPRGTLVAYATEPGNTADDGLATEGRGLYCRHLLRELARPESSFDDIFKRLRYAVWQQSRGQQIPSYSNGSDDEFVLGKGFDRTRLDPRTRSEAFERDLQDWSRIRLSRDPADHFRFIEQHPGSALSELAQAAVEQLQRRRITAQRQADEPLQHPAESRFRRGDRYRMQLSVNGRRTETLVEVTDVDEDSARYTGVFGAGQVGMSTLAGAVISDGIAHYEPPYVLLPGGEYQVGKRWAGRSMRTDLKTGQVQAMDYAARVVGRETIEVPAGRFQTYRVHFEFQTENRPLLRAVYWADPDWGIGVSNNFQFVDANGRVQDGRRELISRTRAA